jgi:hypothetical protein
MEQLLYDFLFGWDSRSILAIAWFLPLLASAVGGVASSLLAPKAPTPNSSQFQLGAGLPGGSVDSPFFNYTNALSQLQTQPNAAQPFLGQQTQFRDQQLGLSELLAAAARGEGPSLAQTIVDQNRQKGVSSVLGAVASQPGRVNAALSQRLAAQGVGAINAQALEQAKTGRLAEIQAAQQQLGQLSTAGRQGDISAGGLAVQGDSARQAAIAQILQLAQAREAEAARLAAEQERLRLSQGNLNTVAQNNVIGGAISGVGSAIADSLAPKTPKK